MPLNIPTTGTENNVSFGPGRVYMDQYPASGPVAAGSTPTTDVGWIGEDGVTVELTSEKKNIVQGNPQLVAYSFCTTQTAMINFTSIQWDFDNFILALGAGTTSVGSGGSGPSVPVGAPTGSGVNFDFGGNPLNTMVAMRIEHQMAVTGDTMYVYAWKAQSESGFSIPMTATEEHSFEFSFQVVRSTVDWCNAALPSENQLIRFYRQTT